MLRQLAQRPIRAAVLSVSHLVTMSLRVSAPQLTVS